MPDLSPSDKARIEAALVNAAEFQSVSTPDGGSFTRPSVRDLLDLQKQVAASKPGNPLQRLHRAQVRLPGAQQ